jgi:hypothetical protein
MMIASFIALLVGVFIIFNTFSIAVNQRWKEIGILRAIGVERQEHSGDVSGRGAGDGGDWQFGLGSRWAICPRGRRGAG